MPSHLVIAGAEMQREEHGLEKPVDIKGDDEKTRGHRGEAAGRENADDGDPGERGRQHLERPIQNPTASGRDVARLADF